MKQLTIEAFKGMLNNALTHIKAREDEFSKLDHTDFHDTGRQVSDCSIVLRMSTRTHSNSQSSYFFVVTFADLDQFVQ